MRSLSAEFTEGNLIQEEELARGSVPLRVYLYYIRNMGWIWALAFLISSLALDGFIGLGDFWLADWTYAGLGNTTVSSLFHDLNQRYLDERCEIFFQM